MKFSNEILAACVVAGMATSAFAQDAGDFYGGVEVLNFQWSDTDGDDSQEAFSKGFRATVGYNFSQTSGVRLRAFQFSAVDDDNVLDTLDIVTKDLEFVSQFAIGETIDAEFSAGIRHLEMDAPTGRWEGSVGPVVAAKLTSALGSGFGIYGGVRSSIVFGDDAIEDHPQQIAITELGTGVSWEKDLSVGTLGLNLGVESHQYQSVRDDEEDYGLLGLALEASFSF